MAQRVHKKKKGKAVTKKRVQLQTLTIRQAAAFLSEVLRGHGLDPVLTGAACAALYAPSIRAKSIELVVSEYHIEEMEKVMKKFGFQPRELRSFWNPKASFEIHFPPPPLSAGDEAISETVTIKNNQGMIQLLNVTDTVRQRLGVWYRWGDEQGLEHALELCLHHNVDMSRIKRWSEWEWAVDKFQEFLKHLETEKRKREKL